MKRFAVAVIRDVLGVIKDVLLEPHWHCAVITVLKALFPFVHSKKYLTLPFPSLWGRCMIRQLHFQDFQREPATGIARLALKGKVCGSREEQQERVKMDFLSQIKGFNKKNLKDVETVEHKTTIVESNKSNFRWHFGHDDEEEKIEWFDDPAVFRDNCKKLAQKIKEAKNVVVYTGAGISTSAKVCNSSVTAHPD